MAWLLVAAAAPALPGFGQIIEGQNADSILYTADMWDLEIPDMPVGRLSHSFVTFEGRIYFFGGHYKVSGNEWAYPASIPVFNPSSNCWDILMESSPISRMGINAFNIEGKAYLIGGIRFEHGTMNLFVYNSVDVLDLENLTWHSRASFPGYDVGSSCCIGDAIFINGGLDQARDPLNSTYKYDIPTDTWSRVADMQVARFAHTVVALNGKMYSMGGICKNNTTGGDVGTRVAEVYDPENDTWQFIDSLPVAGFGFSKFVFRNKLFLAGGVFTADPMNGVTEEISDKIFVYDPGNDEWKLIGYLPEPRTHFPSVVMVDELYIFGGYVQTYGDATPSCRKLDLSKPLLTREPGKVFELYPNPTTGVLRIRGLQDYHYRLNTLEGRTVQTGVLDHHDSRLDLSHLQAGIYLIRLYNGKEQFCEKLIIQTYE